MKLENKRLNWFILGTNYLAVKSGIIRRDRDKDHKDN